MNINQPDDPPQISIVAPVFNEEENLAALVAEIETALQPLTTTWEVILVDDKSTDSSAAIMHGLAAGCTRVRPVQHRVRSGQSAALASGFAHARGDIVVTMDSDLQNNPADLPRLLEALQDGVDCVCGVRAVRQDSWLKRASSRIGNGFRNVVTGDRVTDAGCTYRAIRKSALHEIPVFNGMHRFLPTLLRMQGYCVVEIPISHRPRIRGVSKYGIGNRAWRGIVDCLAIRWFRRRCVNGRRVEAGSSGGK